MRFLPSVLFLALLEFICASPRPEDVFSSGLTESNYDENTVSSGEPNPLDLNSNEVAWDPNKPIFDSTDDALTTEPPIIDTDGYISSDNIFGTEGSVDLTALQSSCQSGDSGVTNDVLRARDSSTSCSPRSEKGPVQLPELFQGPESWWRRFLPKKGNPSSPKTQEQGQSPLDSFWRLFDGMDQIICPAQYPIRCCTDLLSGINFNTGAQTLYYIKPADCIQSKAPPERSGAVFLFPFYSEDMPS